MHLRVFVVLLSAGSIDMPVSAAETEPWPALLAAYATRPQGYPSGKPFARHDTAVPFRWHAYHDGAVERYEKARMQAQADPYNPLEGQGVRTDPGSPVRFRFVAEHRTEGQQALRIDCPAEAIRKGKAVVHIQGIAGGPSFSDYLRGRGLMNTASCYGAHYRWIKLDIFNPSPSEVPVRLSGVPFVLHPGANVLAVKTADAVERGYACVFSSLPFEVTGPGEDVALFLDNVRMEQEVPAVIAQRGRMFQFAARADDRDPPVLWPGFTAVEARTEYTPDRGFGWTLPRKTRQSLGHTFRSMENGILWGRCSAIDSPFRIDLPNGRYGLYLFAAPAQGFPWPRGGAVTINGKEQQFIAPRDETAVRRMALGGETVDYRPGLCVWEALVRDPYYPPTTVVYADVSDGQLLLDLPRTLSLHALMIFPAADREEALQEIGRWHYLLAESWDVSHPWVKGGYAERAHYIGLHDEMVQPETIPKRLRALQPAEVDFERGFLTFSRGLTEAVYPDTIPTPEETAIRTLDTFAAPGQHTCVTFGLLPLRAVQGLRVAVSDLGLPIDLRVSRYHQKTMQFGHHNHDYNYQEHYLVHRPRIDLHPATARRVYLDVTVPPGTRPGKYSGRITISGADDKPLATLGLNVEVLPVVLREPPVYFASSLDDPALKDYGFNAFATSYDRAAANGYKAYVLNCGHVAVPFQQKRIGWSSFIENKPLLAPLIEAGRAGKSPRGFFGGPAPGTHANPKADEISRRFFEDVSREFPGIDLLGRSVPVFHFRQGKQAFQLPSEWVVLAAPPVADDPKALEQARASGKDFWYIDGLRHSKEQAGRFTFGLWLWRIGATGRFTTLEAHLHYGGGTARESYRWEPYFTLLDVNGCNVDRARKESLTEGQWNHCRDLILLREGIDDYRYLYTLERLMGKAESDKNRAKALLAARQFLNDLRADISPDLAVYYSARSGAYGENWYPLPSNPWNTEKLTRVRREAAGHILALSGGH